LLRYWPGPFSNPSAFLGGVVKEGVMQRLAVASRHDLADRPEAANSFHALDNLILEIYRCQGYAIRAGRTAKAAIGALLKPGEHLLVDCLVGSRGKWIRVAVHLSQGGAHLACSQPILYVARVLLRAPKLLGSRLTCRRTIHAAECGPRLFLELGDRLALTDLLLKQFLALVQRVPPLQQCPGHLLPTGDLICDVRHLRHD
jgi:hypothetical protein